MKIANFVYTTIFNAPQKKFVVLALMRAISLSTDLQTRSARPAYIRAHNSWEKEIPAYVAKPLIFMNRPTYLFIAELCTKHKQNSVYSSVQRSAPTNK